MQTNINTNTSSQAISTAWVLLFVTWVIATASTLTSLFFSEVIGVPVCVLCWYQRIAMYPLVIILALGLFPYDSKAIRYTAALTVIGWFIALFHVLLVAGIIPESTQPCVQGVPCTETHIIMGFINIPIMSLLSFTVIGALLFFAQRQNTGNPHVD